MRRHVRAAVGVTVVAAAVAASAFLSGSTPSSEEEAPDDGLGFIVDGGAESTPGTADEGSTARGSRPGEGFRLPDKPNAPGPKFLAARIDEPLQTRYGRVKPETPLGSNRWLLIRERDGHRATALLPGKPAGRTIQLDLRDHVLRWTQMKVVVDQSDRRMELWHGSRVLRRWTIAVGAADSPTPNGHFSVTDRVIFRQPGPYGRFALGLSVHQETPLPGWDGEDQVAIHGTDRPDLLGQPVSYGCVRAPNGATKILRSYVPLGAPVVIRA